MHSWDDVDDMEEKSSAYRSRLRAEYRLPIITAMRGEAGVGAPGSASAGAAPWSRVYTGAETRALDRRAIDECGIPGFVLMHRAGVAAFRHLRQRWPDTRRVTVVCGAGNNAGDGYIVAGAAADAGLGVQLVQIGDPARIAGDAAKALSFARERLADPELGAVASDGWQADGDVIADALLGTGVRGEVRPAFRRAIDQINASERPVLALDLPSGIDADSGAALMPEPVRADLTVTFVAPKLGLVTGAGVDYVGELRLETLDIPERVHANAGGVPALDGSTLGRLQRNASAHKGQFGRLLILGGDVGMGGAVILAGGAALRTGAGLVTVGTAEANQAPILARYPELMARAVEPADVAGLVQQADAVVVGPGLGQGAWGTAICQAALAAAREHSTPLLIDADALNSIARLGLDVPPHSIITPHPGEAGRLLGLSAQQVQAQRPDASLQLSSLGGGCVAALKGAGTLIAENGQLAGICLGGNPRMATPGSGDVLSGIGGALLAHGLAPLEAAKLAVWLHARAGDEAARATESAMLASDIIDNMRLTP